MKAFLAVVILSVSLTVVVGQCGSWGAPYGGCSSEDKRDKTDLRSGVPQKIFQDPDDRETALEGVNTGNKMDSKSKNGKIASQYPYKDIKAYLKNLYQ